MALVDVPLLPESYEGSDARVMRWLRAPGDTVALHEPLVEIETDKVTVEIAAPAAGRLAQVLKQVDEVIGTGDVLGRIEAEAGAQAPAPAAQESMAAATPRDNGSPAAGKAVSADGAGDAASGTGAVSRSDAALPGSGTVAPERRLSPAARTLLAVRGLSAQEVIGTGRGGRITARDVETHQPSGIAGHRIPHTPMRRRIAANMLASATGAPHVTAVFEADLTAVTAHRERHRAEFEQRGVPLSYTAYFIAACAPAFAAVPEVNARFHADALEVFDDLNIGIGTALGADGLVVPVMRQAQRLDLFQIAQQLSELLGKARGGTLSANDTRGGTFTITNHGVSGSLIATPIIQPSQVAILGIGKMQRRPKVVVRDGVEQLGIATQCFVTLTIDHRALDGYQANGFLSAWVRAVQSWAD